MSKGKFRGKNCLLNNSIRLAPTIKKNDICINNFNKNLSWRNNNSEKANITLLKAASKFNNDGRRKQNDHHNILKSSFKSINLHNLQQQQCPENQAQQKTHHFEKNIKQKPFKQTFAYSSLSVDCNKKPKYLSHIFILPAKMTENHCRLLRPHEVESKTKLLQLQDAMPSHSHCHKHHNNSQFTWLKQVPQHKEILYGMLEVLPPPLLSCKLSTLSSCEVLKPDLESKYQHHICCLLHFIKQRGLLEEQKKLMSNQALIQNLSNFDYDRILKYLQKKAKPSDHDVIFGSAYHLLNKCCAWENSRINWLLKLEQENLN